MQIKSNYSLTALNTFHLKAKADYYVEINTTEELEDLVQDKLFASNERLILGGGSNILFLKNFRGIVIHPKFSGIEQIREDESAIFVKVGSGVVWDDFVRYAVENNLGGIENLSLIPGNVGASPIQNIGAYGVEVKNVIEKVEGYHFSKKGFRTFNNSECRFGYRTSIFKKDMKNSFLITSVTFRLSKSPHVLTTNYGIIEEKLQNFPKRSISVLRKVISDIRNAKLPDAEKIGNAGSFFKNPVVNEKLVTSLKKRYPDISFHSAGNGKMKLSAAWLIDNANCKGIRFGDAGTYEKQPLVIVNLGNATGKEILDLANYIQDKVRKVFDLQLEPEVNII